MVDYAVVVDADSLEEVVTLGEVGSLRLLIAAQVGPVRLIDNSAAVEAADDARAVSGANAPARQLERIG